MACFRADRLDSGPDGQRGFIPAAWDLLLAVYSVQFVLDEIAAMRTTNL
jgi:hypothetical protein